MEQKDLIISKIEKEIGTYSTSITRSIATDIYNKVVKDYIELIENVRSEAEGVDGYSSDEVLKSICELIDGKIE